MKFLIVSLKRHGEDDKGISREETLLLYQMNIDNIKPTNMEMHHGEGITCSVTNVTNKMWPLQVIFVRKIWWVFWLHSLPLM